MEKRSERKNRKTSSLVLLETPGKMSPTIRDLFMRVADGDERLLPMMHQVWHYRRHPEILAWCIRHRITGPVFFQFLKTEFDGSVMSMVKFILGAIDSEPKEKITYGIDWVEPF